MRRSPKLNRRYDKDKRKSEESGRCMSLRTWMTPRRRVMGSKQYYKDHKAKGLCAKCPEPAEKRGPDVRPAGWPYLYCRKHRLEDIAKSRKLRKYRKDHNLCTRCGFSLDVYEGDLDGNIQCPSCSSGVTRTEMALANYRRRISHLGRP